MELNIKNLTKDGVEIVSIKEYIERFQPGMTWQGVSYAIDNDKIDYVRIGHERLVVMTDKTKQYVPNDSPKRGGARADRVRSSVMHT